MIRKILLATCGAALVSACNSQSQPTAEAPQVDEQEVAAEPSPGVAPSSTAPTHAPIRDLGLTEGVYTAADGGSCPPPMASLVTFDGKGFNSRNSMYCDFVPASRKGSIYVGPQTCSDPYSGERRTEDVTVEIEAPTRFVLTNPYGTAAYRICPDEKLSDYSH